jgi:hypothetical protein
MEARSSIVCPLVFAVMTIMGLAAVPAFAQFDRGQISGIVKDPSGAVVPGATVTVTNQQTSVASTTVSDGTGYYIFASLQPGLYDISVELQGFKKFAQTGVRLDAAGKLTIDATLQTGELTETVTVAAESTLLQSDTAVRKTIETRDIQDLALNGRNPINLALLKAGVRGGTFNSFNPDSLTTGGYNINGSRSDENLITVDGVIATRTRSSGAIIGTQNVDAIDEVQILTSNYLPEYGRSSGGQIRFVSKSGGSAFRGSAFEYYRDEKLDANSWSRNKSPLADQNSGPAAFSYNQFGFNFGGPLVIPGRFNTNRDKMFFFVSEEWIRWRRSETTTNVVPTEKMRNGDFSELLVPNPFFSGTRTIRDPLTGEAFPNNVIPPDRLSKNGLALLRTYPLPTGGFQSGANNNIISSPNPRDTRKDNVRVDYRPTPNNNLSVRFSYFDWKSVDAFRGDLPLARTDWDRPNTTLAASWTGTLRQNLINEFTYGYSLDEVYINVFREGGLFERSRYGIDYPYVFPQNKEIFDKIPTISISGFRTVDGGPYPASSLGPIHTWSDNLTWLKGRHTFKTGVFIEYSGEDDFDQINVTPLPGDTNNQNGRFEFTDGRAGGTGLAIANAAMGLFTSYGEIGQRALTKWRGLGTDLFVQDSWKPWDNLTVEYGTRYAIWKPWYAKLNNAAMFYPDLYDPSQAAVIDRSTGRIVSGDRFNGVSLPGSGWPEEARGVVEAATNPEYDRLFRGVPRGFSQTHYNVWEPRLGISYSPNYKTIIRTGAGIFHNRVTLNDSTLLGGNAPIQFKVGVQNGSVDAPTGTTPGVFPLLMTLQDPEFKHPTAYNWSVGVQRELPWKIVATVDYVGRRGIHLQREQNINQLPLGTRFANPNVNPDALRPYLGFSTIRLSENAGKSRYNGLQVSVDRRYSGGFKLGIAYTLSKLKSNADDKRDIIPNTYDDTWYWAVSRLDRTHVFNVHYIYDLPFLRNSTSVLGKIAGGWQISGVTFLQSGEPLSVTRGDDIAGVGDSNQQPWGLVEGADPTLSRGDRAFSNGPTADENYWFNKDAFTRPANGTFGNAPRNLIRGPGFQTWDIALLKNFAFSNTKRAQFRLEIFNFPNHPNWSNPNTDPTSADFGRVVGKSSERNIQLGLKFYF